MQRKVGNDLEEMKIFYLFLIFLLLINGCATGETVSEIVAEKEEYKPYEPEPIENIYLKIEVSNLENETYNGKLYYKVYLNILNPSLFDVKLKQIKMADNSGNSYLPVKNPDSSSDIKEFGGSLDFNKRSTREGYLFFTNVKEASEFKLVLDSGADKVDIKI